MAYILEGNNAEEIWQLNQINEDNKITKKRVIDFLDIDLNYKIIDNSIINYDFKINTSKTFINYADVKIDFGYLDIVYVSKGIAKFSSKNIRNSLVLKEKEWAIVSSEYANKFIYKQMENTDTSVSHIIITPKILNKFIEFDNEISILCQNIIEMNSKKHIIACGIADFNIQLIIGEIEVLKLKEENDKLSQYMYISKIEELFLTLISESLIENNKTLGSTIHQIIVKEYKSITIKNIADMLKISETTLRNTYKKDYNITPSQAIFETKMNKAKMLLQKDSTISLKDLSLEVGYKNSYRFSQDFKSFFINK